MSLRVLLQTNRTTNLECDLEFDNLKCDLCSNIVRSGIREAFARKIQVVVVARKGTVDWRAGEIVIGDDKCHTTHRGEEED